MKKGKGLFDSLEDSDEVLDKVAEKSRKGAKSNHKRRESLFASSSDSETTEANVSRSENNELRLNRLGLFDEDRAPNSIDEVRNLQLRIDGLRKEIKVKDEQIVNLRKAEQDLTEKMIHYESKWKESENRIEKLIRHYELQISELKGSNPDHSMSMDRFDNLPSPDRHKSKSISETLFTSSNKDNKSSSSFDSISSSDEDDWKSTSISKKLENIKIQSDNSDHCEDTGNGSGKRLNAEILKGEPEISKSPSFLHRISNPFRSSHNQNSIKSDTEFIPPIPKSPVSLEECVDNKTHKPNFIPPLPSDGESGSEEESEKGSNCNSADGGMVGTEDPSLSDSESESGNSDSTSGSSSAQSDSEREVDNSDLEENSRKYAVRSQSSLAANSGIDKSEPATVLRLNEYLTKRSKELQKKQDEFEEANLAEKRWKEQYKREWEAMAQEEKRRKREKASTNLRKRQSVVKLRRRRRRSGSKSDLKKRQKDTEVSKDELAENPIAEEKEENGSQDEKADNEEEINMRAKARVEAWQNANALEAQEAEDARFVRQEVEKYVRQWSGTKTLAELLITIKRMPTSSLTSILAQLPDEDYSKLSALQHCRVARSSEDIQVVRKVYRRVVRVIHPDKLKGATIVQKLEAQELFTILTQAFESFQDSIT